MAQRLYWMATAATAATVAAAFPRPQDPPQQLPGPLAIRHQLALRGPELRAARTAESLGWSAAARPELADLDAGDWTGRPVAALAGDQEFGAFLTDPTVRCPKGESIADLVGRVGDFLAGFPFPDGRSVIVAAPMVLRAAFVTLLRLPMDSFHRLDVPPLSHLQFSGHRGRWNLRLD